MKHGRLQCKDINDRQLLQRIANGSESHDGAGNVAQVAGWLLYGDVAREQGLDWQLIESKMKRLERRGLVVCEDSYCWLTEKGWEQVMGSPTEK